MTSIASNIFFTRSTSAQGIELLIFRYIPPSVFRSIPPIFPSSGKTRIPLHSTLYLIQLVSNDVKQLEGKISQNDKTITKIKPKRVSGDNKEEEGGSVDTSIHF